jgi:hypothetical protein
MSENGLSAIIRAGGFLISLAGIVVLYESIKQIDSSKKQNDDILLLLRQINSKLK